MDPIVASAVRFEMQPQEFPVIHIVNVICGQDEQVLSLVVQSSHVSKQCVSGSRIIRFWRGHADGQPRDITKGGFVSTSEPVDQRSLIFHNFTSNIRNKPRRLETIPGSQKNLAKGN
jgi:hypothetical protein